MSRVNSMRMGKQGGGDSSPRDLFQSMNQGSMGKHAVPHGLFASMHQGHMKGTPGCLRPGRTAPSIARSMSQGGK